jgi:hypothetical protein
MIHDDRSETVLDGCAAGHSAVSAPGSTPATGVDRLPMELWFKVIDSIGYSSSWPDRTRDRLNLSLVSPQMYRTVLPMLYEKVCLYRPESSVALNAAAPPNLARMKCLILHFPDPDDNMVAAVTGMIFQPFGGGDGEAHQRKLREKLEADNWKTHLIGIMRKAVNLECLVTYVGYLRELQRILPDSRTTPILPKRLVLPMEWTNRLLFTPTTLLHTAHGAIGLSHITHLVITCHYGMHYAARLRDCHQVLELLPSVTHVAWTDSFSDYPSFNQYGGWTEVTQIFPALKKSLPHQIQLVVFQILIHTNRFEQVPADETRLRAKLIISTHADHSWTLDHWAVVVSEDCSQTSVVDNLELWGMAGRLT